LLYINSVNRQNFLKNIKELLFSSKKASKKELLRIKVGVLTLHAY